MFARVSLGRGENIGVIRGQWVEHHEPTGKQIYTVELDEGCLIAEMPPAGLWLLNHSCQPNAKLETLTRSIRVVAIRDIAPGSEITCDYRPSHHEGKLPCRCASPACAGRL